MTQEVVNVEVRERLNIQEDLLQIIMGRKLRLFGHIMRMDNSRKIKVVMLGNMERTNRRGRRCREWLSRLVSKKTSFS